MADFAVVIHQRRRMLRGRQRVAATITGCAAALLASVPDASMAQTAAAATNASAPSELQEVVVTARRREEDISNVPISITALGPDQLADKQVHTESDLQISVPGLIVRTTAVSTQQNYSLRGQSIDSFTGSSPAVLAYVNDVEANTGSPTAFFDLASIQVLKGPQGTLFGRNTTGGAVLYTTAKPEDKFGGFVDERVGNLGLTDTTGAINLPFSDNVLLRVAGDYYRREGYQHDIATGKDYGGLNRRAGRVTLLVKPIEGLENETVAEYGSSTGNPTINEIYSVYPCGSVGLTTVAACTYSPLSGALWTAYVAAHPSLNPGGIVAALSRQQALGVWAVDSPQPNGLHAQNWSVSNTTTYSLTQDVQLKNIFGASRSYTNFIADQMGIPYGISEDFDSASGLEGNRTTLRNYSDEVQLLGKALDTQLDYVIGFYYSNDRHEELDELTYFDVSPVIPGSPSSFHFIATSRSEAAYAQGTYDLSNLTSVNGLKFTGGLRYTWETDGLQYPFDAFPASAGGALLSGEPSESKQFRNPSWNAGFDWQGTAQTLLYIVTRGSWRSGGFNGYSPSAEATAAEGGNEFLPEKTHDVEIGAKYRGNWMDIPSVFNIAVYNQWITNIQRVVYATSPGGSAEAFTGNIAAGQARGVELDAEISPLKALTVGASGAYTDSYYSDGTGAALVGTGLTTLHYGPAGDVSRWSGSVFANLHLPTPDVWGPMSLRAELYGQSYEYFSNLASTLTPGTRLPGYGIINLRYDWKDVFGSALTVSGFAKNLANHGYYTGGEAFGVDFGLNNAAPAEPRTYGAELNYRF
jgi:iron complex outermembrane recepter protein